LDKKIGISLPDPALAMAYDIAVLLKRNNISFLDYTTSRMDRLTDSDQKLLLTSVVSPPLKEIIYWFNHKSVNLYGEQLLRTLGQKFGKSTSTNDGVKAMLNFWSDKGIDKETLNICDGSGLSPTDRVTTLSMAKVLSYAQKQVWFGTYLESFPTHNDLKMKSGTIGDVLAYAGYANVNGEVPVCFSLMINNYNGSSSALRQKMFVLLNELK
jgi:D-alanyl-D-alanine carboxypeptidase/D-alanyl-D-alanine-endopeptidase (penicillin-binding protein 4)